MTAHNGPLPVPARITMALDARELYGPEVDRACGVEEPAVDEWELGIRVPTDAQMLALAQLTRMPVAWFYRPADETCGTEEHPHRTFICERGRRKHALTIVRSWVDWDGVLHRVEETPPHPPLRVNKPRDFIPPPIDAMPSPAQTLRRRTAMTAARPGHRQVTVHQPVEDPETPGVCATCRRPTGVPNDAHGPLPDVPAQAAARTRVDPGDD